MRDQSESAGGSRLDRAPILRCCGNAVPVTASVLIPVAEAG